MSGCFVNCFHGYHRHLQLMSYKLLLTILTDEGTLQKLLYFMPKDKRATTKTQK